jgi:hypothetical protein
MPHHRSWVTGLVAVLAALVLAPTALATSLSPKTPDAAKAKERAYGKHCGHKGKVGARAKCLDAMAKLASGDSVSPKKACRAQSKKRVRGERKSAFARCVREGTKLMLQASRRAGGGKQGAGSGPDEGDEGDQGGDESTIDSIGGGDDPDVGDDPTLDPNDGADDPDIG